MRLLIILFSLFFIFQSPPCLALTDGLALTPPMGWNSWNKFGCENINEKLIKEIADAMISNGMSDAGYEYIGFDYCWHIDSV